MHPMAGGFLARAFAGSGKTTYKRAEATTGECSKSATEVLEPATGTLAKLFAENAAPSLASRWRVVGEWLEWANRL